MAEVSFTFRGMNNVADPANVGAPDTTSRALVFTEVVSLKNVDPSDALRVSRRVGQESLLAVPGLHSAWSSPDNPTEAYFVNGPLLNRLNADGSVSLLRYNMVPDLPVAYCQVNNVVCYSNGLQTGIIENGVNTPPFVPTDNFKAPMVAGKTMDFYNGRLYALVDNYQGENAVLVCSDAIDTPGGVESMDTRQNIVAAYDGEGVMVAGIETDTGGGIFVSTTLETFWHGGKDAVLDGGFDSQVSVAPYPAIPGTVVPIKGELTGIKGLTGNCVIWTSVRGVCIGGAGGFFQNLTQGKFSYPVGLRGAAVLRESRGQVHYIASLRGGGEAYNAYASNV